MFYVSVSCERFRYDWDHAISTYDSGHARILRPVHRRWCLELGTVTAAPAMWNNWVLLRNITRNAVQRHQSGIDFHWFWPGPMCNAWTTRLLLLLLFHAVLMIFTWNCHLATTCICLQLENTKYTLTRDIFRSRFMSWGISNNIFRQISCCTNALTPHKFWENDKKCKSFSLNYFFFISMILRWFYLSGLPIDTVDTVDSIVVAHRNGQWSALNYSSHCLIPLQHLLEYQSNLFNVFCQWFSFICETLDTKPWNIENECV